jgi:hypothetical protein
MSDRHLPGSDDKLLWRSGREAPSTWPMTFLPVTFQLAEVSVSQQMFAEILPLIGRLRAPPAPA